MPTPATGPISMGDVNTETNWTQSMYNFFQFSTGGGLGTLMYHNLSMGLGAQSAKEEVYVPFSSGASGTNLNLGAWYNYNQEPNGIFDINLTNNQPDYEVNYNFYLGPTGLATPAGAPFASGTLTAGGGTYNVTDLDSTVAMSIGNFPNGVYNIYMDATAQPAPGPPPPPPFPTINATGSASDTDNVGAGLVRVINTGAIAFDQLNPLPFLPIVQGNIGAGDGIYLNKRTTFSLTFS